MKPLAAILNAVIFAGISIDSSLCIPPNEDGQCTGTAPTIERQGNQIYTHILLNAELKKSGMNQANGGRSCLLFSPKTQFYVLHRLCMNVSYNMTIIEIHKNSFVYISQNPHGLFYEYHNESNSVFFRHTL